MKNILLKIANTDYGRDLWGLSKDFPKVIDLMPNGFVGDLGGDKRMYRFYSGNIIEDSMKLRPFEFKGIIDWFKVGLSYKSYIIPSFKPYPFYNTIYRTEKVQASVDGSCLNYRVPLWVDCQGSATSNFVYTSLTYMRAMSWNENTTVSASPWSIERSFLLFDTASLPDGMTITDASLSVYVTVNQNGDNDGDDWVNVVQSNPASNTALITGDYDQCGSSIDNPTEGATRKDLGSITTNVYNTWSLNTSGKSWISKTGVTKLGFREGHDCIDSAVSADKMSGIEMTTYLGSNKPYLTVT